MEQCPALLSTLDLNRFRLISTSSQSILTQHMCGTIHDASITLSPGSTCYVWPLAPYIISNTANSQLLLVWNRLLAETCQALAQWMWRCPNAPPGYPGSSQLPTVLGRHHNGALWCANKGALSREQTQSDPLAVLDTLAIHECYALSLYLGIDLLAETANSYGSVALMMWRLPNA